MTASALRAELPPLHVVTDDAAAARPDFLRAAAEIVAEGGPSIALHLRAPSANGLAVYRWAEALRRLTRAVGALLLVNDRVDVALAVDADGVQLGRRGLRVADARRLAGAERLVGVSVHTSAEVDEAREGGADFVLVGNVYATGSHPGRAGIGVGALAAFAGLPLVAIGGVTPERVAELRDAGVQGVAAIRGVWDAPSPARAVRSYLKEWMG
ncbi:MAG TPA: thiamine phosphate synthase [Longimicrobium sp.]|jgi:thiamine-phosphate pyrophosphorylase